MSYLNYQYIKAYYTGGGVNGSNLGTIIFNVPDDAVELPFKAKNQEVDGIVNGSCFFDNSSIYNGYIAMSEAKSGILTQASNPAGYFYFIKMGEIFIADRIVALGTSYNELYEAGYIDGKFRVLSKEEYETTLSSNEEKGNIDKWHKNINWARYSRFYGEISSTTNDSDQIWVYGLLGHTGDWSFSGDFYNTQTARAWNSKENRNYLFGGDGGWYMLGSYRPAIDINNLTVTIYNNLKLGE